MIHAVYLRPSPLMGASFSTVLNCSHCVYNLSEMRRTLEDMESQFSRLMPKREGGSGGKEDGRVQLVNGGVITTTNGHGHAYV